MKIVWNKKTGKIRFKITGFTRFEDKNGIVTYVGPEDIRFHKKGFDHDKSYSFSEMLKVDDETHELECLCGKCGGDGSKVWLCVDWRILQGCTHLDTRYEVILET